jgi:hypothetical protein
MLMPFSLLMRVFHGNARGLLGQRQALQTQDDDLEKMAYIKEGRRRNETSG